MPARVVLVEERAREIGRLLSGSLDAVLRLEEGDPQLHAVARVAEARGAGVAAATSSLVALVSYRLTMRGEEWWDCYSRYFTSQPPPGNALEAGRLVAGFLDSCRGSLVQREAKKRRVERASRLAADVVDRLLREPWEVLDSASWLITGYARALGQKPWRKTIVFSAKMAYYSARAGLGERVPAPRDAPIPVDVRVSCITYTSRMVEAPGYRAILSNPIPAIQAWNIVSEESGIPPLNLDSLAWLTGWLPRDLGWAEALERLTRLFQEYFGDRGVRLAKLLFSRPCR